MSKDLEERYKAIVNDLEKNKELKKKVTSYLEKKEEKAGEDIPELISVTEAARRCGITYLTMRQTCRDNIDNKEYPFVRRIGSRLMVRPDILSAFLKGE